jgi:hypothetical protein
MVNIGADRIESAIMGEASAHAPSNTENRMRKCAFDAGEPFRIVPLPPSAASGAATYDREHYERKKAMVRQKS